MEGTGRALVQRVTAVVRAKQFLVFFAIGLYALDVSVPLLSARLRLDEPFLQLLQHAQGPLADAATRPGLPLLALFAADLLLRTWLRAGYLRSLTGAFHFGAASGGQYVRLLALLALLDAAAAGAIWATKLGGGQTIVVVALVGLLALSLALAYADYAIVLSGAGPLRAIALSWRTVRLHFGPTVLLLLMVTLASGLATGLVASAASGSLAGALPLLLMQCVVVGGVAFVADVTLLVLYLATVESGQLTRR